MLARVVALVVLLVAAYEFAAVYWDWWPTITEFVRPRRDVGAVFTVGCAVIQLAALWAMVHLFGERGGW